MSRNDEPRDVHGLIRASNDIEEVKIYAHAVEDQRRGWRARALKAEDELERRPTPSPEDLRSVVEQIYRNKVWGSSAEDARDEPWTPEEVDEFIKTAMGDSYVEPTDSPAPEPGTPPAASGSTTEEAVCQTCGEVIYAWRLGTSEVGFWRHRGTSLRVCWLDDPNSEMAVPAPPKAEETACSFIMGDGSRCNASSESVRHLHDEQEGEHPPVPTCHPFQVPCRACGADIKRWEGTSGIGFWRHVESRLQSCWPDDPNSENAKPVPEPESEAGEAQPEWRREGTIEMYGEETAWLWSRTDSRVEHFREAYVPKAVEAILKAEGAREAEARRPVTAALLAWNEDEVERLRADKRRHLARITELETALEDAAKHLHDQHKLDPSTFMECHRVLCATYRRALTASRTNEEASDGR